MNARAGLPPQKDRVREHFDRLAADYRLRNYEQAVARGKYPDIFVRHQRVLELLPEAARGRCLEIGVGSGEMLLELHARGHEAYGVDLAAEMARQAERRFIEATGGRPRLAVADLERLCFRDASFDLVVLAGVIEYQADPEPALAEIARVLRPGGTAILSVRNLVCLGRPLVAARDLAAASALAGPAVAALMRAWRALVRRRAAEDPVAARREVPWRFRRRLRAHGLQPVLQAFYHFAVLPEPLQRRAPRLAVSLGLRLESLSRTPLGYLGRGCIFVARKADAAPVPGRRP